MVRRSNAGLCLVDGLNNSLVKTPIKWRVTRINENDEPMSWEGDYDNGTFYVCLSEIYWEARWGAVLRAHTHNTGNDRAHTWKGAKMKPGHCFIWCENFRKEQDQKDLDDALQSM